MRSTKIEEKLSDGLSAEVKSGIAKLSVTDAHSTKLTEEEKTEVVARGKQVVTDLQVKTLQDVVESLRDDFLDKGGKYVIIVDRLDEDWVEDPIRYRLIRALIDTIREFKTVSQLKILIGLRIDLLESVLNHTRDSGFQEEKYLGLCLPIKWNREQLIDLVENRIGQVIRDQFAKNAKVKPEDIISSIKGTPGLHYIIDRTLNRPRDVIAFFNACIEQAIDKPQILPQMIEAAEFEYSRQRLRAVADEWQTDYPGVAILSEMLRGLPSHFTGEQIGNPKVEDTALKYTIQYAKESGQLAALAKSVAESKSDPRELRALALKIFYRAGLIGFKPYTQDKVNWFDDGAFGLSTPIIESKMNLQVHKTFWRALGIVGKIS